MLSREQVQGQLNLRRKEFGRSTFVPDIWNITEVSIDKVVEAGVRHSCPVVQKVLSSDRTAIEIYRSYQGKNNFFLEISQLISDTGRQDLLNSWNSVETRSRTQKTHPEVKLTMQYPEGYHRRQLPPNARMVQYYVSDHFKTLDHITHGANENYASSALDQQKYSVLVDDYRDCAIKARDLVHFTALVAVRTAHILKERGVENTKIAKLLSQNFAQTGSIREYGQQKQASLIVGEILKEIKSDGHLKGLASEFRTLSRPKVEKSFQGKRNPRL